MCSVTLPLCRPLWPRLDVQVRQAKSGAKLIGIADSVIERVGDRVGDVEEVFGQAMDDLGRLSTALPTRDPRALARRVLAFRAGGGFGATGALIRHLGGALGVEGRAELRRATEAALKSLAPAARSGDWREHSRMRHLASQLALLADLERDADAFIAAIGAAAWSAPIASISQSG